MGRVKFLHCSDIHMDMPFTSLGAVEGRPALRRQDLKETFQRIIRTAEEEQVDFLLICGDLYEHEYTKKSTIQFINDRFKEISPIRVIIVPGNHDPYIINSFYQRFEWNQNVYILSDYRSFIYFEDVNTCFYGAGFNSFNGNSASIGYIENVDTSRINILLMHGTLDMNFNKKKYNPVTSSQLASLGMDYIALGHFHKRVERSNGNVWIYNPGSPEPLGFDEPGDHGVFLGTITKALRGEATLDIRFDVMNKRYYKAFELYVDQCTNDEQVLEMLYQALKDVDRQKGILKVTLKGFLDREYKLDAEQLQRILNERFFFVRLEDETVPDYDFDQIKNEPGLRGIFTRKMFSLIENTLDEDEKRKLQRALYFGLEALEQGKISI